MFVAVFFGLTLIIVSTMSSQAYERESNLYGDYWLNGTRVCVQPNGNNVDFIGSYYQLPFPVGIYPYPNPGDGPGGGTTRSAYYKGRLKLYGNGKGRFTANALQINHQNINPGFFPVLGWNTECDVTYKGHGDDTIEVTYSNCEGPFTEGYLVGNTTGGITPYTLSGRVSANEDTLLLSDTDADVETIWSGINNDAVITYAKRICVRNETAIRLSPHR